MSDFGRRYVVDTNALSQLGRRRRASEYFLESAVIPEAVRHEAKGFPDITSLRDNVHPTTPRVLQLLVEVMATVPDTDTRLVNLYANLGNADPLVVACALEGQEHDGQYLIAPEWFVVTGDEAVRDKAEEFGLKVLSNSQFAALIDGAGADKEGSRGGG
jgi:rRNA maturation endonuclease Nob1